MNEITSMIPQYGELNRIYTDILSGKGFSFESRSSFPTSTGSTRTHKRLKRPLSAWCLKRMRNTVPYC